MFCTCDVHSLIQYREAVIKLHAFWTSSGKGGNCPYADALHSARKTPVFFISLQNITYSFLQIRNTSNWIGWIKISREIFAFFIVVSLNFICPLLLSRHFLLPRLQQWINLLVYSSDGKFSKTKLPPLYHVKTTFVYGNGVKSIWYALSIICYSCLYTQWLFQNNTYLYSFNLLWIKLFACSNRCVANCWI